MNLFLKKTVLFLILLVLINLVIFLPTNYYYNILYYKNISGSNKSVFLLSDSHGHSLGNYTEAYNVKNLSYPSDSYIDMYRKLRFIHNTDSIRKVYLSVGDRLFTEYRDNSNNHERSIFLLSYSDYDNTFKFLFEQYVNRFLIYPTSKQYSFFKNMLFKKLRISKIRSKTDWSELTPSGKDFQASKRLKKFLFGTKSKLQIQYLESIIKFCKKNNIELILIKFPLTKEFRTNPGFEKFDFCDIPILKSLNIIDYNKIFFDNDEFFKDQDHLNNIGAEEFSKILFTN